MYVHELLSELALIPAWECFLTGFLAGMVFTLAVISHTNS